MINIKPQYFGVAEQVLLSLSNMVVSLVVVKTAGIEWFGIYSFIFVIATLLNAFFSNLLHRQMTLVIASSLSEDRQRVFIATLAIQLIFLSALSVLLVLLIALFSESRVVSEFGYEMFAAASYIFFFNFYELCRQYLYVLDRQGYSLRATVVYLIVLLLGAAWIAASVQPHNIAAAMFGMIAISFLASLASNRLCHKQYKQGQWVGWQYVSSVFIGYFEQGRFRIVGMLVTWAQNQSMVPILMWLGGPLIAGYFSMARLMVMPMAVINSGLTNSTTPELRRSYQAKGESNLQQRIFDYMKLNFLLSAAYLFCLYIAHIAGFLQAFVPEYSSVKWFLLIWVSTLLVTTYRQWLTQFFVLSMQFRFLMNVSILALALSMTGMISTGYILKNVYVALVFIIVGELLSIFMFKRSLPRKV